MHSLATGGYNAGLTPHHVRDQAALNMLKQRSVSGTDRADIGDIILRVTMGDAITISYVEGVAAIVPVGSSGIPVGLMGPELGLGRTDTLSLL